MSNASMETVPKSLRNLRACLLCSLIKTIDQFDYDGCDNCEEYLHLKNNRDTIFDCTSSSFDGTISMMSPDDSWVAKWQGIKKFKPGVYAISVTGKLPNSIIRDLKASGVPYQSRDRSQKAGEQ
ncbi:transcription elongation factor SPT4-like [Clavelina lepadiformis]|uniref:Transcription elongation factor SPT4 n=1 Tax=Clavelina lepadiformis TaxID=159417 RepID=A0ABP0H685_CLALP